MGPLEKSLIYDGIVALAAFTVVLSTEGTTEVVAGTVLIVTILKSPYDAWVAWPKRE